MIKGSCCHRHAKGKHLRVIKLPLGKYGVWNSSLPDPGAAVPFWETRVEAEQAIVKAFAVPGPLKDARRER